MIIEISENRKHKIIEYPDYFEKYRNGGFTSCVSKKQFDYLSQEDYSTAYMFFDYKKKIIYFHEWCEPELTGDCDYAWPMPYNYKKKVFNIWSN
jgi:hypothetical protein